MVYSLEYCYEYEPGYVEGIFSTLHLAMQNKPKHVTEEWEPVYERRYNDDTRPAKIDYWHAGNDLYIYRYEVDKCN
jgi:hypothetical protein